MNFDWKKESEGNYPVFPDVELTVKVSSVKRVESAKKKTPGLHWDAVVVEPLEYAGRRISVDTWLTETSLFRVAKLVEACGLNGMPAVDTNSEAFLKMCSSCIGRTTRWTNEQGRDDKDRPRNNIVDFQLDDNQSVVEYIADDSAPDWAKS